MCMGMTCDGATENASQWPCQDLCNQGLLSLQSFVYLAFTNLGMDSGPVGRRDELARASIIFSNKTAKKEHTLRAMERVKEASLSIIVSLRAT